MTVSKYQKAYDKNKEGVLNKSIRAGKWLTIDFFVRKLLNFAPFFILARLLTPADFGALAIILLVPRFLQSTSETGLATAAIQKGGDPIKYLNPIWTLNILRSLIIAIVVFLAGPYIANFYNAQSVVWPIRFGGIFIVIYQLSNIGEIWFTKELDFKKVFIRNTIKTTVYAVVSVGVALIYPNYWALVIATLALHISETISTYFLHPYRPKLSFEFGKLKELTGYSKWIVGQIWLEQLYNFAESSIVARTTNTSALGLHSKARNLASIAPGSVASVITMISLPAYAKIKESKEKIVEGLKKSLDLLFVSIIPVIVVMIVGGGKIVEVLLGDQWIPMTNPLRIFLVFFTLSALVDIAHKLFNGIGFPDKKVKLDTVKIVVTVLLLLILTPKYGIVGAASAITIGLLPSFALSVWYLIKITGISLWSISVRILSPLALSLLVLSPAIIWKDTVLTYSNLLLLLLIALGGIVYAGIIWLVGIKFQKGPYNTIKLILKTLPKT